MCKAVSWEERYRRHNPWVLALLALAVISLTLFSGGASACPTTATTAG